MGQHVTPTNADKWNVRKSGSARASKSFPTQQDAIDRATVLARSQRTELYIHGRDGRIQERISYSDDK